MTDAWGFIPTFLDSTDHPAGNRKLDKDLATLRIDPLVAAVMAAYEVSDGAAGAFDVGAWIA